MTNSTYQCEACKKTFEFESDWTEEEAVAEYESAFAGDDDDKAVVCDDCYQEMKSIYGF